MKLRHGATGLAALVLTQAALAQQATGSVQIYGTVGAAVTHKTNQTGGVSNNEMSSSLLAASAIGLRGTEDLGGGMSAVFRLESALNPANGTAGGAGALASKFWNRQAFVGLGINPAVTITAGRQFPAGSDRVIRSLDVYQVGGTSLHVTPLALFGVNRFLGNDGRSDSSVKLRATGPVGLQGAASVGLNDGAGRSVSFDLAQVTGSYAIGLWASKFEAPTVIAANGVRPEHDVWGVGGNLPLGPVRLYLHYLDSKLDATVANRPTQTNKIVHLGANWQATPQTVVKLALYDDRGKALNGVAGRNGKKTTWVASGEYFLSKRTSLNATAFSNRFADGYKLEAVNIAGLARDPAASSTQGLSIGIRHDF